MNVALALAIYFVIWWTVLFAILPFGVRSQSEGDKMAPGTDPGAPITPHLFAKLMATTLVAAVIFAIGYGLLASGLIDVGRLPVTPPSK